jgi:serpin B
MKKFLTWRSPMTWLNPWTGLCAIALILVCTLAYGTGEEEQVSEVKAEDLAELAEGNTEFALDLYRTMSDKEGNLFLSPYSISSALAMTCSGARGNTAKQMAGVLNFTLKDEALHEAFASLTSGLNERGQAGDIDLSVANALWGQKDYTFLEEFVDLNRRFYKAGLDTVDFAKDPEGARKTINAWVGNQTQDEIVELIKRGLLDPSTVLVLTNAIYFHGGWASRFDPEMTKEEPFWLTPDASVTVEMMHQARRVKYLETQALQIVELPYQGDELSTSL